VGIAVALDPGSGRELQRMSFAGTGNFGQNAVAAVVTRGTKVTVAGVMTNMETAQDIFMDEFDVLAEQRLVAGQ
jgi:hypothetical protein